MIELTTEQSTAAYAGPLRLRDPQTNELFVLVKLDEFDRLSDLDYDDSPWTREEIEALNYAAVSDAPGDQEWDRA